MSATPLRLAHTDWLYHRLAVTGPPAPLAAFAAAAIGAGTAPWHFDFDDLEEDWFHRLVSPQPPQARTLSVTGARVLAGQLRAAAAQRHQLAIARIGRSAACPLDLHALLPVPAEILALGPDDPAALAWLWETWGTTQALRHVTLAAADAARHYTFWSADWSPWRAIERLGPLWAALRFDLRPSYETA